MQLTPHRLKSITLECSLKPFFDLTDIGIAATCTTIWENWRHLLGRCDAVSVLLWVGSGDEILTWSGRLGDPLPCAQQIGFCNLRYPGAYDEQVDHYRRNAAQPYCDHVPTLSYADLKRIIIAMRRTAMEQIGKTIDIGATLDPGPEFVDSEWRYERHRETLQIKQPNLPYPMHFVTHQCSLRADDQIYAGFPGGISEGMPLGTFLGRQFEAARQQLGFDFLWMSNGFGYSHHPWISRGDLFDGERFKSESADAQRKLANRFWCDLRSATDARVEVRGSNFSVGMDLATDGCSHRDIWMIGGLQRPPCNPPWGSRALGLEMTAYLSRLAKTPTSRLPFRFYLNDPWFVVTSWYDYYAQEPFDVYVPMAAARMNEAGGVDTPTDLNLLTIDTSYGQLLEDEAAEFTPHMLAALDSAADAAGPVVWVYPFDEYDGMLKEQPQLLSHAFAHDWFMCRVADSGFPLNTVCASDVFVKLHEQGKLSEAVYVAPVPVGDWKYGRALMEHVRSGGKVLLYGSTDHASEELLTALAMSHDPALEGLLRWESTLIGDRFEVAESQSSGVNPSDAVVGLVDDAAAMPVESEAIHLMHRALVSGGGVSEIGEDSDSVRAVVAMGEQRRTYAVVRSEESWRGGKLAWMRGTVGFDPTTRHLEAAWDRPNSSVQVAELMRGLLAELNVDILQERHDPSVRCANVFFKRHRGAWYVTGHKADTSARFWLRTGDGAPAYEECETPIVDGRASESFGKSFHKMVRLFVKMTDGIVRVKRLTVPVGKRYQCSITDLTGADVTIYPDTQVNLEDVTVMRNLWTDAVACELDHRRHVIRVHQYTGALFVTW